MKVVSVEEMEKIREEKMSKVKKISKSADGAVHTLKKGTCVLVTNITQNEIEMPFVHDTNDNKIKTMAQMVYEEKNGKLPKGYIARPICGNMNCINIKHIEEIKANRKD